MRSRGKVVAAVLGLVAVVVAVALGVLSLGGGGTPADPPTVVPTSPEPGVAGRAPLTGLEVADGADLDHPAVAIKVSDVRQAHPQVGVDRADIVFVEPIGVAYTRIAAVFHSDVPETVGPVRSVRPMDAALLSPLAPVFGNTMGAEWVMRYVDDVGDLDDLGSQRVRGSGAYVVDPARPAPDHVLAKPQVLLDLSERTAAPEPYFTYSADPAESSAAAAGGPGESVTIPYGPSWTVSWSFDADQGRYLRSEPWGPHTTQDGTRVAATNVLVLDVDSRVEKLAEGEGAPVPVLQLVDASGDFVALSGGRSVTGTWSKAGVRDAFELVTDDGAELLLAPGSTWVEMPTPEADVVVR